jgi:hypothetical protein
LPTHPVISGDWIKQEIIGENLSASKFSSLLQKLKFSQKYFAFIYNADNIKIAYLFFSSNVSFEGVYKNALITLAY